MIKLTPLVRSILIINIIFYLTSLLFTNEVLGILAVTKDFKLHQLLTYQFCHVALLHLVFNMLALIQVGPLLEKTYPKFLLLYLTSGIGSALLHMLIAGTDLALIGASGSIWGIFALWAGLNKNDRIKVIIWETTVFKFVQFMFGLEVILALANFNDGIAHWGHIGGAITGFILFKLLK